MNKNAKQINQEKPTKRLLIERLYEDKMAISKCRKEGGDVQKLAKEREITFVTPF